MKTKIGGSVHLTEINDPNMLTEHFSMFTGELVGKGQLFPSSLHVLNKILQRLMEDRKKTKSYLILL